MGKRTGRNARSIRRATIRRRLLVERLGDRRVLAAISGAVFEDLNGSLQWDAGEGTLSSRLIYIDANDNAQLDVGERMVVAESDGTFAFQDVADGTYLLRLFNGTPTQQQTFPVEPSNGQTIPLSGQPLQLADSGTISLTSNSVVVGDGQTGQGAAVGVATELTKMQTLPDGSLMVIGQDAGGQTAWRVNPATQSVTAVGVAAETVPLSWSDLAIDGSGHGVLVQPAEGMATVFAVDASSPSTGIDLVSTATEVPADTQVLSSASGPRSVFGWADAGGMQLSLWSNSTATPISESPIDVSGSVQMLAFDDAAGVLVTRSAEGGINVLDVNQDFATLHTIAEVSGPVTIDGARDLLMTVSPIDAVLRVIDLHDGDLVADLALDLSEIGQAVDISIADDSQAIVLLGTAGMVEVALNRPSANRVQVNSSQNVDSVLFGVTLSGSNAAPNYQSLPGFTTPQNVTLSEAAPAALEGSTGGIGAVDAEGDIFVLVQAGPATSGIAVVDIEGAIVYTPATDYTGVDQIPVLLHDGRDVSSTYHLAVEVTSTVPPTIVPEAPIPERVAGEDPIPEIDIIFLEQLGIGDDDIVWIDDQRFIIRDGKIIFVGGDANYENSTKISAVVNLIDSETSEEEIRILEIQVADRNDPITAIQPGIGTVTENVFGDHAVDGLRVADEDVDQTHEFSVDDQRFVIDGNVLKLADDEAVDFEDEPIIIVNVTATDGAGSSYTQEITIYVEDIREQPTSIELMGDSVTEYVPGDHVGPVVVDGYPPNDRTELTVDDPRFEIVDGSLKLLDDTYVERATQEEIELTITASDKLNEFDSISETFVIFVEENQSPYHNDYNPYDVNYSGDVTSLDALLVINYLNIYGPGPIGQGDPGYGYDVNGDGMVTALDALLILNEIARLQNGGGGGAVGARELEAGGNQSTEVPSGTQTPSGTQAPNGFSGGNANLRAESESDDREQVFGRIGRIDAPSMTDVDSDQRSSMGSQSSATNGSRTSSSSSKFAAGVDQTLRLLSDG